MPFTGKTWIFQTSLVHLSLSFLLPCTSNLLSSLMLSSWFVHHLHTIGFIYSKILGIIACSFAWKIGNTVESEGLFVSQCIVVSGTTFWIWDLVEEAGHGGYATDGNIGIPFFPLTLCFLASWNDQFPLLLPWYPMSSQSWKQFNIVENELRLRNCEPGWIFYHFPLFIWDIVYQC